MVVDFVKDAERNVINLLEDQKEDLDFRLDVIRHVANGLYNEARDLITLKLLKEFKESK